MSKFKKIIFLLLLILIFFCIYLLNDKNEYKILKREKIYLIFKAVKNNEILKYINLSYKNVFLPETLYGKMDYFEKKIKLKNFNYDVKHGYGKSFYKPFYIEEYQNFNYIIERNGNIHKFFSIHSKKQRILVLAQLKCRQLAPPSPGSPKPARPCR